VTVEIIVGDCLASLRAMPAQSVHCCITSPPYYGLRDYGHEGQIGLEETPSAFVAKLVEVFREVRRVLRDDGTLWLNLGDSYAGSWGAQGRGDDYPGSLEGGSMLTARMVRNHPKRAKHANVDGIRPKNLIGIPWRVAFALQDDGWYLRQDIIWHKPNPMPESVRDRCTKAHEYIFLLSKCERYYFDGEAIAEEIADASVARLSQRNLPEQRGSTRVPGKTNGNMKAVGGSYSFARSTATEGMPGARAQHRADREPVEYRGRRNKRSVWTVTTKPFKGAHFATFPPDLIEPCVLAGCPVGGVVLDPFGGAGTTGVVAQRHSRSAVLCELNPDYARLALNRIRHDGSALFDPDPLLTGATA
jgi:DNA modification methylase